jgi:hypothetical protein
VVVSVVLSDADHRHFHDRDTNFDHSWLNRLQPAAPPGWLARFARLAMVIYSGGDSRRSFSASPSCFEQNGETEELAGRNSTQVFWILSAPEEVLYDGNIG